MLLVKLSKSAYKDSFLDLDTGFLIERTRTETSTSIVISGLSQFAKTFSEKDAENIWNTYEKMYAKQEYLL